MKHKQSPISAQVVPQTVKHGRVKEEKEETLLLVSVEEQLDTLDPKIRLNYGMKDQIICLPASTDPLQPSYDNESKHNIHLPVKYSCHKYFSLLRMLIRSRV